MKLLIQEKSVRFFVLMLSSVGDCPMLPNVKNVQNYPKKEMFKGLSFPEKLLQGFRFYMLFLTKIFIW